MAVAAIAEVVAAVTVMMTDTTEEEEAEGATTATIPAVAMATITAMARQGAAMLSPRPGHQTKDTTTTPDRFPADRISPVLVVAGTPVDVKIRINTQAA